jgi:hypothetical protein
MKKTTPTSNPPGSSRSVSPSAFLMRLQRGRKIARSWAFISDEIAAATNVTINRGLLSAVAHGKRQPSNELIAAINRTYHKRFRFRPVFVLVTPAPCGCLKTTTIKCSKHALVKKPRRVEDVSLYRLKNLIVDYARDKKTLIDLQLFAEYVERKQKKERRHEP